jgi:Zn-dependent peptidase ImmA (M78 family)
MTKQAQYNIYAFVKYAATELKITSPYRIKLSNDRSEFTTLAYYDPNTGTVAAFIANRHPVDIMRSLAHELTHHLQKQRGELKPGVKTQDIGGKIEDEANSVAGQLIKKFGYANPQLRIWDVT